MLVILESKEDSREIPLARPSASSTYGTGGRAGVSVLEFEIEEPGNYILSAQYPGGVSGPNVVFAVGQFKIMGIVIGGLCIIFGTLLIGGFIIIRAFLKRRSATEGTI